MNILFAASEAHPYIKTGGLADVCGNLPPALAEEGANITLILPGYASVLGACKNRIIGHSECALGYSLIREVLQKRAPYRLLLVDHPLFSNRKGNPYSNDQGEPWHDNDVRFAIFSQVICQLAMGRAKVDPLPSYDLIHCHDWQTGLVPALLSLEEHAPPTIFTIHNLAYQGTFPTDAMWRAHIPESLYELDGLEFHQQVSFIKGGIQFAHRITTVSPNYADEIKTVEFGCGLEGLLQHRESALSGIVNGIDDRYWNPRYDKLLPFRYGASSLSKKAVNKRFLQSRMKLPVEDDILLLGMVSRLVDQKGTDLLLEILPDLMDLPVQLIVVGTGDAKLAKQLNEAAALYPQQMAVFIGYDEELAHWVEAGADAFLMPSRFEPCGLNQMYSQAYGTPPIASHTGGLADTISGYQGEDDKAATGFFMKTLDARGLLDAILQALDLYRDLEQWQKVMKQGMARDFSWKHSAKEYMTLYQDVVARIQATRLENIAKKITQEREQSKEQAKRATTESE